MQMSLPNPMVVEHNLVLDDEPKTDIVLPGTEHTEQQSGCAEQVVAVWLVGGSVK